MNINQCQSLLAPGEQISWTECYVPFGEGTVLICVMKLIM